MKKIILSLLLLIASCSLFADYPLEIIDLKSRPATEMIPLIQPFMEPEGVLTGTNYQLIIRTSPYNLEEIQQLIARFDTPAKSLMIYVRQASAANINRRYNGVDIDTMVGKNTRMIVGSSQPNGTIRYRTRDASTQSKRDATHRVQVVEGHPAFIQTGRAIPTQELATTVSGGVVHQQVVTRYRNATSGFYVVPRINGEKVTLDISPNNDRPGSISGTYDIQQAHTVVSGRLGEWIALGGVDQSKNNSKSGISKQAQTGGQENQAIEVLVEEISN